MDGFDPAHICNHSDHCGSLIFLCLTYIAHWNLFALCQALMPLF